VFQINRNAVSRSAASLIMMLDASGIHCNRYKLSRVMAYIDDAIVRSSYMKYACYTQRTNDMDAICIRVRKLDITLQILL